MTSGSSCFFLFHVDLIFTSSCSDWLIADVMLSVGGTELFFDVAEVVVVVAAVEHDGGGGGWCSWVMWNRCADNDRRADTIYEDEDNVSNGTSTSLNLTTKFAKTQTLRDV